MSRTMRWAAAAAGVAAALLGAGAGELVAALFAPSSSPFAVVGGALIDVAPAWAKDTAIAWFGTNDKAALLVGIAIVLLAASAIAGLCEARWARSGVIAFAVLGVGVGVLALTRPDAGFTAWVPSVLAGAVAAIALRLLNRVRMQAESTPAGRTPGVSADERDSVPASVSGDGVSRRRFLVWVAGTAVAGVVLAAAGSLARAGSTAVTAVRDAIRLPRAAVPAPAIPADAELGTPGLTPVITPNQDFYRIDTALVVPSVDPADWRLRIHGMVAHEVTLTWDDLLALPLQESAVTLSCVSNIVGGDLVGNAVWLGYPIRELLKRAQPDADADMVLSTSVDGFTAGTPLEALTDDRDALLAIGMNGEPLPLEHGFPVRMVVPGLYGYVSATKWVTDLEVTRYDRATAYWTDRGWSAKGPIKLQSRIDVPRARTPIPSGDTVIAGVAWQPHSGVSGVEVQIDDGPWQRAELATAISDDTWVQWLLPWQADAGEHELRCRAIGSDGEPQTGASAPPAPDGATGWHTVAVSVS
ncbi:MULTISPECIES: molybdopterin-dependent oxidoreductase [unclassified Microbacterium]|uniref:molybdopterin-dependent oxidoreductase n=1 Tax=unclassified Microbacterium TaxID=2609290 RepID=UPI0012FAFD75|nr:molybdopterin-dependent oxidoreductase [Microbacterium sp. MAH-37]MVQ43484.1 molybdopterin-dependent oxidoreductase [Microbacterium sp. MAH-37]